jgi:RNA polymerase sigma-70 factor (ECF subfamily)
MSGSTRAALAHILADRYNSLRDKLTRRLGSSDRASEALHDTWLRLNRGEDLEPVANPEAYIVTAAMNAAAKRITGERRRLDTGNIDDVLEYPDDAPDAERVAIGKSEVAALKRTLKSLTRRQRDIFVEIYINGLPHQELAERYSVSVRTVQGELRIALLHVADRFIGSDRFANEALRVSRTR